MFNQNTLISKFFFSFIASSVNLLAPFIILPYVTKVLGPNLYGKYIYFDSIIQYLILFISMGTLLYGSREIGYVRGDKNKEKQILFEIIIIRLGLTIFVVFGFLLLLLGGFQFDNLIYFLSINLISSLLDVSFYFQGVGDFKKLAFRSMMIKLVSIILMFIFVKDQSDFTSYIVIVVLSNLLANIWISIHVVRELRLGIFSFTLFNLKPRASGILKLFLLQMSISIYMYLGKTMLGSMTNSSNVAIFDIGSKIIYLILTLNSAISSVIMPEISHLIEKDLSHKITAMASKSLVGTLYLMVPIFALLNLISNELILLVFGIEFKQAIIVVNILSFVLLIAPVGNVIGIQVLIPLKKELILTIAPFLGLIVSFAFNYLLIPLYGLVGASITSVLTELVGVIYVISIYGKVIDLRFVKISLNFIVFATVFSFVIANLISMCLITSLLGAIVVKILLFGVLILGCVFMKKDKFMLAILSKN
jgi:O-antigen/teichoic acid export membrane protein